MNPHPLAPGSMSGNPENLAQECERCGGTGIEWSDYWSQDAEPCRDCGVIDA